MHVVRTRRVSHFPTGVSPGPGSAIVLRGSLVLANVATNNYSQRSLSPSLQNQRLAVAIVLLARLFQRGREALVNSIMTATQRVQALGIKEAVWFPDNFTKG